MEERNLDLEARFEDTRNKLSLKIQVWRHTPVILQFKNYRQRAGRGGARL